MKTENVHETREERIACRNVRFFELISIQRVWKRNFQSSGSWLLIIAVSLIEKSKYSHPIIQIFLTHLGLTCNNYCILQVLHFSFRVFLWVSSKRALEWDEENLKRLECTEIDLDAAQRRVCKFIGRCHFPVNVSCVGTLVTSTWVTCKLKQPLRISVLDSLHVSFECDGCMWERS